MVARHARIEGHPARVFRNKVAVLYFLNARAFTVYKNAVSNFSQVTHKFNPLKNQTEKLQKQTLKRNEADRCNDTNHPGPVPEERPNDQKAQTAEDNATSQHEKQQ